MTEAQRHQILLELLAQTGFITVEKVIERLGISPATARRDINKLDESGKLCLNKAKLIVYSHGDYLALGRKLGSFGYSVRKKKKSIKK